MSIEMRHLLGTASLSRLESPEFSFRKGNEVISGTLGVPFNGQGELAI
ncbi:MAG: hypothetical protein P4L10_04330 [Acidobacteriaceae bacterium]|jgi:hypothetical protein|nr:hypothetical protein [Acidobacteriaceae bacterium]